MALRAQGVRFGYRAGRTVLTDVSASIEPGSVTAIIGPNGAGKSTLVRLLAGLLAPDAGQVTLDGEPVAGMPATTRAERIAYVSQRGGVAFSFAAGQVVRFGRYSLGGERDDRAVGRAMERMEVAALASSAFDELSAGQQQRVMFARALAQLDRDRPGGTRVLLADEPFSAMDPRHVAQACAVMRGLAGEGLAVAVVLHDFAAAGRLADRVLVLHEGGTVAACGAASEVLRPGLLSGVFSIAFRSLGDPGRPVLVADDAGR
ncbi:MAG: ABC transporter ATP-binding protein [Phycisphaerae bacterium]|nr:ABC transporter ATP-binding protein [Phycisphaerae bacterium]